VLAGVMLRAIPILLMEQSLTNSGASTVDAPIDVQVLTLADTYETLISPTGSCKLTPLQAEDVKSSGRRYDSMVVDAFVKAYRQRAQGAGA
jgi:hypothetical protein